MAHQNQAWRIKTKRIPTSNYPSLGEAAPHYVEWYKLDHLPAGATRLMFSLKHLLGELGSYKFPSITGPVVEDYKRKRLADGVSPSTINKELAALSGFAKWANDRGYCERLHIKRFPLKLTRAPIPVVPSRTEMVRFLRALPRHKRGLCAAMYSAACASARPEA